MLHHQAYISNDEYSVSIKNDDMESGSLKADSLVRFDKIYSINKDLIIDEGFVTTAIAYKKLGKGAVIMVNSNEGFPMLGEIINAIAIEYRWPDFVISNRNYVIINNEEIKKYIGEYYDTDNNEFKIENSNDSLYLIYQNQNPIRINKTQEGSFGNEGFNFSIFFTNDTLKFTQEQVSKIFIKK